MNMKKAIIVIASTAIAFYTIKIEKSTIKTIYIIHTLLKKNKRQGTLS